MNRVYLVRDTAFYDHVERRRRIRGMLLADWKVMIDAVHEHAHDTGII